MSRESILNNKTTLGIELGSTRIKAILIDENFQTIAIGAYNWENEYINNIWTYSLENVWLGIQCAYKDLCTDVKNKYNTEIKRVNAIGFSGMMHGYLPFDKNKEPLCDFRTWRNTITGQASSELSELFNFNIPQRWSISHLYQAILNNENHVNNIDFITTIAGYVHWKLTDNKCVGIGEASGMFPIDEKICSYNKFMISQFNKLVANKNYTWKLENILPNVMLAGKNAGFLTEEGALLIDPSGMLESGIPLCAPEGDAGTGMVATKSISERTGNISAGTSIFGMIVLEKPMENRYKEIDIVTTPVGKSVAMVHCNNCTNEINAWMNMFKEVSMLLGGTSDMNEIFTKLFKEAMKDNNSYDGIISYNYLSGEEITNLNEGRPMVYRGTNSNFKLGNFMLSQLYSACATLRIGMNILEKENVDIDAIQGHGGFFKTALVGQQIMSAATKTPISVMETASEGGAWGMAVLAKYMTDSDKDLYQYLDMVFADENITTLESDTDILNDFNSFMIEYKKGLVLQEKAINL